MISHLLVCPDGIWDDLGESFEFSMDFALNFGPNGDIGTTANDAQRIAVLVARASCCN